MASSDSECDVSIDGEVELGFLKQIDSKERWRLHRCYFPSKLGGKPAWLDPQRLPSPDEIKCGSCGKPLVFLLQIYAPNEDNQDAFHRTIFVFCCKTETCYASNSSQPFCVFRCQLKRENDFYESDPPNYDSPDYSKSCKNFNNTCESCGCKGNKFCSRCHQVLYCCKEHQVIDWKHHKLFCGKSSFGSGKADLSILSANLFFPEMEIFIESEGLVDDDDECSASDHESLVNGSFSPSELEQFVNRGTADEQFSTFRKSILHSSDQILRYDKGGEPLWCSSDNQLKGEDIPKCDCGSPRQFEFQVMPQLLNHLDISTTVEGPSIDWGILAVYTCTKDCYTKEKSYVREYLHKQDFSQETAE